jgi:transposase
MGKTKPPYPPEFRAEAIRLVRSGGVTQSQVARDLGVSTFTLRNWLRQTEIDAGEREGLTTDEREELRRLRRENRVLREEREILKKAAVGSGGRRNDGCEPISWSLEGKRLARTTIEARGHGVEIGLSVDRQIGLLREVLA